MLFLKRSESKLAMPSIYTLSGRKQASVHVRVTSATSHLLKLPISNLVRRLRGFVSQKQMCELSK